MVLALFLRLCRLRRTHIFLVRLRLFASKRRKDGSCGSVISFNPSSSFPSFPFAWKGTIEKRERLPGVSDFLLKGAALYAERFVHHYKHPVPFYRDCERVTVCGWDWGKIDSQSCTVVPKMYLRTSLYLSIFAKISSKSRIFTLFNKEKS